MRLVVLLLVATCTLHGVLGKHYLSALPATNVTCDLGIIHPDTSAQLSNVVSCLEDVSAQEQVDECCPWLLFLDQGACLCSEVLDLNDGADHSRRDSLGRSVRKKGSEGFLEAMRTVCSVTSVNDCSSVATSAPTVTTASPTSTSPTFSPTSASPTASPTATPTTATPTSAAPTVTPTTATPTSAAPTVTTLTPTSAAPTGVPTATPTNPATAAPTATPTNPVTAAPTATTSAPSAVPVAPPPLASRRLLAEPAECANATALQDERVANVQMLSGLMFSEATLLQDLTSALTAILHPNAYLEVYPLGSFQGMEDIAEAVHLLFRPAANRRWVTLERNGTSMVTSSSTANLWVVEDVVDADSTLAQTLPDLLKEDAPPAPAQLAVRGVLRQRVQFGTCGALIGSVTLELPTGLAKRLLDNRSPLKVTCAAAIDACFLAALPGGGTAEERMHWALTNGEFVSVAATAAAAPPFSRAVFEQAVESCVGRAARYGPVDSHCESSAGYRMNAPGKTEMKQGRTSSCDFLNSMLAELNPMKYCMRWMTDHHLNPVGVGYGTYGFHNQRAMCEECYHDVID